jgi:hypothetical protein
MLASMLGHDHSRVFLGVLVAETAAGVFTPWLLPRCGWKQVRV